jgi:hypothetical protein
MCFCVNNPMTPVCRFKRLPEWCNGGLPPKGGAIDKASQFGVKYFFSNPRLNLKGRCGTDIRNVISTKVCTPEGHECDSLGLTCQNWQLDALWALHGSLTEPRDEIPDFPAPIGKKTAYDPNDCDDKSNRGADTFATVTFPREPETSCRDTKAILHTTFRAAVDLPIHNDTLYPLFACIKGKEGCPRSACPPWNPSCDPNNPDPGSALFYHATRRSCTNPVVLAVPLLPGETSSKLWLRSNFIPSEPPNAIDVGGGDTLILHCVAAPTGP